MNGVPLADKLSESGELIPPTDSFELLSKPTLDLTDEQLLLIANDLRAKRVRFLKGIADKPARAKAEPVSDEAKKATTEHLLNELDGLQLILGPK